MFASTKRTAVIALCVLVGGSIAAGCGDDDGQPETDAGLADGALGGGGGDAAPAECVDNDGDGYGKGCEQGSDCDDANADCNTTCTDADGDGRCPPADCDDESEAHWDDCEICVDDDGDGYGENCNPGIDCDPDNRAHWSDCEQCIDDDGDHHGPGCDLGEDCAPDDTNHWNDCAACVDADLDFRGEGCDLGTDCDDADHYHWSDCGLCIDDDGDERGEECDLGPDCDEEDPTHWSDCGGICADTDGDNRGQDCDLGPDCNEGDPNHWSDCDDCNDRDSDGRGNGCDLGPDCAPRDPLHWDDCEECVDNDGDGYGENCDLGIDCRGNNRDDDASINPGAVEICDDKNNDCNGDTADGSGDPQLNAPCDGDDSDACSEGVFDCSGGVLVCTDETDDSVEVCDGVDNDCDGERDDFDLDTPAIQTALNNECFNHYQADLDALTDGHHVENWECSNGACLIKDCETNYYDCDKSTAGPTTGCEELDGCDCDDYLDDEPADALTDGCDTGVTAISIGNADQKGRQGHLAPSDETHVYRVTFTSSTTCSYNPRIFLADGDDEVKLRVSRACTGSSLGTGLSCGSGEAADSAIADGITEWELTVPSCQNLITGGENQIPNQNDGINETGEFFGNPFGDGNFTFYVEVSKSAVSSPYCYYYNLIFSNFPDS